MLGRSVASLRRAISAPSERGRAHSRRQVEGHTMTGTPGFRRCLALGLAMLLVLARDPAAVVTAQATACSAFDSQIWTQSVFDTNPTQYTALDPDGNGLACEQLVPGAALALWTHIVPVDAVPAQFVSVTDGDTIHVLVDGQNDPVRLILIDTPETHDPHDPAECFGQEATAFA